MKESAFLSRSGPSHGHCCVIRSTYNPCMALSNSEASSAVQAREGFPFVCKYFGNFHAYVFVWVPPCVYLYKSQRKLPVLVLETALRSSSLAVLHRGLLLDKRLWSTFADQELPGGTSCPAAQLRGQRYSSAVAQEEDNKQDHTFS